jgi:hypothetical protein
MNAKRSMSCPSRAVHELPLRNSSLDQAVANTRGSNRHACVSLLVRQRVHDQAIVVDRGNVFRYECDGGLRQMQGVVLKCRPEVFSFSEHLCS